VAIEILREALRTTARTLLAVDYINEPKLMEEIQAL
jgi:hypothetical protein